MLAGCKQGVINISYKHNAAFSGFQHTVIRFAEQHTSCLTTTRHEDGEQKEKDGINIHICLSMRCTHADRVPATAFMSRGWTLVTSAAFWQTL